MVDGQLQVSEQDVDSLQAQLPTNQNGFSAGEEGAGDGARAYHIAQILIALPEEASSQQVERLDARRMPCWPACAVALISGVWRPANPLASTH
jgi:hypothetical protein